MFLINLIVVWSIKCQRMVKNAHQSFLKANVTPSNVLFCQTNSPKLKDFVFVQLRLMSY